MMFTCAHCKKECYFHRWYSSDDMGNVKSTASDTPTYYTHIDDRFIPFCSSKCSTEYYEVNIRNNDKLELNLSKWKTKNAAS